MEDYYAVLGIDHDVDDDELKRAWKALATRWHPDRAGPDATFIFQKLLDAYNVLSDPKARAAYDKQLGVTKKPPPSDPPVRRKAPGQLIRRLSAPLDALIARRVAKRDGDMIELALDEDDVREGGMATISMRVMVHCPACNGARNLPCERCAGHRMIDDLYAAWLAIPPGIADGTILIPSAQLPGVVRPVHFRVRTP
jgi:DnaJ-class molecular chaperone